MVLRVALCGLPGGHPEPSDLSVPSCKVQGAGFEDLSLVEPRGSQFPLVSVFPSKHRRTLLPSPPVPQET